LPFSSSQSASTSQESSAAGRSRIACRNACSIVRRPAKVNSPPVHSMGGRHGTNPPHLLGPSPTKGRGGDRRKPEAQARGRSPKRKRGEEARSASEGKKPEAQARG